MNDEETSVLHWLSNEGRWETISWDSWVAFRGILHPSVGLSAIAGGIHHFIVCVRVGGRLVNLIPHKYLINLRGEIGADNFGGLTREERDDYSRIMMARESIPDDTARLSKIREKLGAALWPPIESIDALLRQFLNPPDAKSAAAEFLSELASAAKLTMSAKTGKTPARKMVDVRTHKWHPYTNFTGFDWDDGNRLKCQEHGVSLEEVEAVMRGSPGIAPDMAHSLGEQRFIAVGRTSAGRPVFVAFTLREREGQVLVRPVSVRYMHSQEAARYEQQTSDQGSGHDE